MQNSLSVELTGVSRQYPGQLALDDVSLDLRGGEVHSLVGENGAGKSTLIKILAGVEQPDTGRIRVDGSDVAISTPAIARDLGLAFVHQEPTAALHMSVAENVFIGDLPTIRGTGFLDRSEMNDRAAQLLSGLGVSVDPRRILSEYGAATRRVVEIARALAQDARLLVLDEPTAALPREDRQSLLELVRRFADTGGGVLYVSHHLDEIMSISDRLSALRNGKYVGTIDRAEMTRELAIEMILGEQVRHYHRIGRVLSEDGAATLKAERVRIGASSDPFDFRVRAGEVVGLFGRVDAGHEQFCRILVGDRRPAGGILELGGKAYAPLSPYHARRRGVGVLPGERKRQAVFALGTVTANINAGGTKGTSFGFVRDSMQRATAETWRSTLGIKVPSVVDGISTLSGGNQQKTVFARLLAREPQLLVLENPTAGVDLGARQDIYRAIDQAASTGLAVVVLSDDLDEIRLLSDRVVVFRNATVAGELEHSEVSSEAILELAL
ncbi:MAG: sugar ABC transporter ATP-binding protein [Actinomycetota bacterium]|nr:sugar ABC transporter ATP-binding protein [Actinomycetota bacterium]